MNKPYDKHLDGLLQSASETIAKDILRNIPADDELKEKIVVPDDLLYNIKNAINAVDKKKLNKRKNFRVLLVAAMIIFFATITATFSVTAFRINILNTMLEIKNSTFQLFQDSVPKNGINKKSNQKMFNNLIQAKNDIKFDIAAPTYTPEGFEYEEFEVLNNGQKLDINFVKGDKRISISEQLETKMQTNRGTSLDTNNTSVSEYKIMGSLTKVFSIKTSSENSNLIRWQINGISYTLLSNMEIGEIKRVIESFSEVD